MSEHTAAFIAALKACEEEGFICEEKCKAFKQLFYIYSQQKSRLGVVHCAHYDNPERPSTQTLLIKIFGAHKDWPKSIAAWSLTMPWGKELTAKFGMVRLGHGIRGAAIAVTGATQERQACEPTEDMQTAARNGASRRQMSGMNFGAAHQGPKLQSN